MADITLTDLTEVNVAGTGVFDTLMRATQQHLNEEYQSGRIQGNDYATVYLGAMTAVMQQSIVFLLGEQEADKKADLLQAQIDKTNAEKIGVDKQNLLLDEQLKKLIAETELLEQQKINLISEELLIDARTSSEIQKERNLAAEELNIPKQGDLLAAQKLQTEAQTSKVKEDERLVEQQRLNLINQDLKTVAETTNVQKQGVLIEEQTSKTVAETSLLNQKKITEDAQTQTNVAHPDSTVGKQQGLYQAQTDGFARDAEQKLVKLAMDGWVTGMTVADEPNLPAEIGETGQGNGRDGINQLWQKAMRGINDGNDLPPAT